MGGELRSLMARQHGVVTRGQLLAAGMTPRMIEGRLRSGRLHAAFRGVYAVGRPDLGRHGWWMAGALAGGPAALLSHRSAAALWDLSRSGLGMVEVTSPHGTRQQGLVSHESLVPPAERIVFDAIAVTTVPRTLIDLAEVVSRSELQRAVHQAYRLRRFDPVSVAACIERHSGRNGAARLRTLLADHPGGAHRTRSWLETTMLALCRKCGLPPPEVNVTIEGRERDFFWPDHELVVETDGRDEHLTPIAFETDRERDALLMEAGYHVRRFTYRQLTERPAWVAARIRAALERRDRDRP